MSDPYLAMESDEPAEYTAWTEKDRFAIELTPDAYLRKLDTFGSRVPDGKAIWEADSRVDRALPEYLEALSAYSIELRREAKRVWESDPHVTHSFLNYLARYAEAVSLLGALDRVAALWRKDEGTHDDLPAFARRVHAAKLKVPEVEVLVSEWESSGRGVTLIEFAKQRRSSTGLGHWF